MLEISDLHVCVGDKEILKGINLLVPEQEVHSLFGPNGSGKSVLISTIMGYPEYEVTKGSIRYKNEDITELSIDERVRLGLGVSEQSPPAIKGVKLRNLIGLLAPGLMDNKDFKTEVLEKYNMSKFLDRDINDGLSCGEMKRAEQFLALITKPKFLLLDEPDSGVDPENLKEIGNMIILTLRSGDNSGLISTHSATILDYIPTHRGHVLFDGAIRCSGDPRSMMEQIRTKGYEYCIECHSGTKKAV
ncbi:MAG: ABC transporter ATP-binding protein [Bacteroidetes bacterium]|nr:MAG: ABC transporter ATP-binding protein [Bacteroidota bacterium]